MRARRGDANGKLAWTADGDGVSTKRSHRLQAVPCAKPSHSYLYSRFASSFVAAPRKSMRLAAANRPCLAGAEPWVVLAKRVSVAISACFASRIAVCPEKRIAPEPQAGLPRLPRYRRCLPRIQKRLRPQRAALLPLRQAARAGWEATHKATPRRDATTLYPTERRAMSIVADLNALLVASTSDVARTVTVVRTTALKGVACHP